MNNKLTKMALFPAVFVLVLFWFARVMLLPLGGHRHVVVDIPRRSSAEQIARILKSHRVIGSAMAFRMLVKITGKGMSLKSGAYELSSSMSPLQIVHKLSDGEASARWITVPEGFTAKQIADHVQSDHLGRSDLFLHKVKTEGRLFKTGFKHPGDNLEGYLFPDSYLIPAHTTEDGIIKTMLDCFDRKVASPLTPEIEKSGMTMNQVITLASLIEKEAKVPKDRPLISAVLRNRLRSHMRLDCDATVLYALGKHKKRVLFRDLRIDSDYNTYRNFGLPPGPIASPGLESIKAALRPAPVDYLYYVAKPDGSHIFSRTMAEHERAIATVRRKDSGI